MSTIDTRGGAQRELAVGNCARVGVQTVRQMGKEEPDELLLNCVADLCTYLRGVDSPTEWAFFGNSTTACAPPL